ncbi:hypothetical protein Tco_1018409 [Tanacetum coccineum]|uniref:Uncharacterized protein n=1 Tax=Tanacetum coccineum TaxID=301880 RepID=A0ABQ5FUR8_9ASTR
MERPIRGGPLIGRAKQCDEDDAAHQEAIMDVITLFEQAMAAKEDMRKQYAECKDSSSERRALLQKNLDDEAWKDYQVKKTLLGCVQEIKKYQSQNPLDAQRKQNDDLCYSS